MKHAVHLVTHEYEWLYLAYRFDATHDLLAYSRWLVRILSPIGQSLVLIVLKLQPHISDRGRLALERVRDKYLKRNSAVPERFSHEPPAIAPLSSALYQYVESDTQLIHGTP